KQNECSAQPESRSGKMADAGHKRLHRRAWFLALVILSRQPAGAARRGPTIPAKPAALAYGIGAVSPRALPTVSFHSLAHSAPQRLAQPASTAPSTSFLWVSASSGETCASLMLASLPNVQGCLFVLQLSASSVDFLRVSHILSS